MVEKKPTVYLGLSGGVDSAVAAALLLEQDYDVIPVFLKCWEGFDSGFMPHDSSSGCPWQEDQEAAYAVAEKLGIAEKFRSWNFTEEFLENVVSYLVDEAKAGRTGNPDVVCNRTIKFGAFLKRALAEGADFVATGHYARVERHPRVRKDTNKKTNGHETFLLLRAKCKPKNDQTYFLWQLNQEQLSRCLFPIGEFSSKEAVREEARRRGLPVAERTSTRGICFVSPADGYNGFLKRFIPAQEGEVVTTGGRVVGQHAGTAFYTLGQRQGIGVTKDGGPYYVMAKDEARNQLVVAPPAEAQALWKDDVTVGEVNWTSGQQPELPFECAAFVRHPQDQTVRCLVTQMNTARKPTSRSSVRLFSQLCMYSVCFSEPQWAPTPGQSVVFYQNDTVLGGGVIT